MNSDELHEAAVKLAEEIHQDSITFATNMVETEMAADGGHSLSTHEREVLDVGIVAGIAACMVILQSRGILPGGGS